MKHNMKTSELIQWLQTQDPNGTVMIYNGEYMEYYPLQMSADKFMMPELIVSTTEEEQP